MPTMPTASRIAGKVGAVESNTNPISVNPMPTGSENGVGLASVYIPISGCSSEAVSCMVNVISPICPKSR